MALKTALDPSQFDSCIILTSKPILSQPLIRSACVHIENYMCLITRSHIRAKNLVHSQYMQPVGAWGISVRRI